MLTSLVQAHNSGLPLSTWEAQLPTCWGLMFTRLQGSRTPKVGTWKGIDDGWPKTDESCLTPCSIVTVVLTNSKMLCPCVAFVDAVRALLHHLPVRLHLGSWARGAGGADGPRAAWHPVHAAAAGAASTTVAVPECSTLRPGYRALASRDTLAIPHTIRCPCLADTHFTAVLGPSSCHAVYQGRTSRRVAACHLCACACRSSCLRCHRWSSMTTTTAPLWWAWRACSHCRRCGRTR